MKINGNFNFHEWENGEKLYTCFVSSVSITEAGTKIINVKGKHNRFKSDVDVQAICFTNQRVEYFPRDLHFIFPALKVVEIDHCGLKEISRKDLVGLENIEEIAIILNELTSLPDDLFTGMTKLKRISFSNNKLGKVNPQILQPIIEIQDMTYIDFSENVDFNILFTNNSVGSIKELMAALDKKCPNKNDTKDLVVQSVVGNYNNIDEKSQSKPVTSDASTETSADLEVSPNDALLDFAIITGNRKFRFHKVVLAGHSQVFAKLFKTDVNVSQMVVEKFFEEVIGFFFHFAYTGNVAKAYVVKLFIFAAKYEALELKEKCETIILKSVDDKNAYYIFNLGNRFGTESFKQAAFAKIKAMFPDKDLPETLLNQPELMKKLFEGSLNRKRKLQEADEDCKQKMEKAKIAERDAIEAAKLLKKEKDEAEMEFESFLKMCKADDV